MTDRMWPLLSVDELHELPEPKWLIGGYVTDGLTVLYGPPGVGKTFLALDWALCIATGSQWLGKDVLHAPVLYVSGEGSGGLGRRISAWQGARHQWQPRLYIIPNPLRLTDREHIVALADDVHSTGARLLVIDTLARAMATADENSSQDMGLVVEGLAWIRRLHGCAALIVHHLGVERSRMRGSTSLLGAVDTVARLDGGDGKMQLTCDKQKDAPHFRRRRLALSERAGSCVLVEDREPRQRGFSPQGAM